MGQFTHVLKTVFSPIFICQLYIFNHSHNYDYAKSDSNSDKK